MFPFDDVIMISRNLVITLCVITLGRRTRQYQRKQRIADLRPLFKMFNGHNVILVLPNDSRDTSVIFTRVIAVVYLAV